MAKIIVRALDGEFYEAGMLEDGKIKMETFKK